MMYGLYTLIACMQMSRPYLAYTRTRLEHVYDATCTSLTSGGGGGGGIARNSRFLQSNLDRAIDDFARIAAVPRTRS